jgi:hypothetical protein
MRDTDKKQYLAYDKTKRKFFSIDEIELDNKDVEIYEFSDQDFRLVGN